MTAVVVSANADAIDRAAAALLHGELVVMPTETVYGLAGDATNPRAVARIYAAKGRPQFNPLISHVCGLDDALKHAVLSPVAMRLAEAFWPGALTLVAQRRTESPIAELACAGLSSVALRAPAHPVAQALLAAVGRPLAAPSANRSGRLSPTHARHAAEDLGDDVALVLDAGPCAMGVESSVVAVDEAGRPVLLRPGAISREALEAVVGPLADPRGVDAPASPGMLTSHYAPRASVRLNAVDVRPGEAYLAFGPTPFAHALNLSPSRDLTEAAANLFAHLRALDATGAACIAVAPIPETGLGEAINDRLSRAAAAR
ncbi:MAG: threonylcarbamoyl-AMP synthase [Hyphomonadaceae bacterium]|nr:MAG: tRNA threonylcarbamoyladenosine biosynthesis protein [Caulobacteraceae bacterium]MBT9445175.1 threonylcarbamoyl-AMP synthase [Hyphomonadaceae bacterium]TPW07713.1 MAG: tRNA threonylcarbamoyladenosine biosynthesis protein [Alphaproteobacteria bacterium]